MSRLSLYLMTLGAIALAPSCSSAFHSRACSTDSDCGGNLVCVAQTGDAVCTTPQNAPLRIGMSGPLSGPNQDLGTEMKKGLALAFDAQNAAGGVRGRPIALDFLDDEYQPDSAEADARQLLEVVPSTDAARCPTTTVPVVATNPPVANSALLRGPSAVLGLVGNVGTPTMVLTAPIAVETGSLFFGAFTGASLMLRDGLAGPCSKYIFNVRASYAQEAMATVEYFFTLNVPDARHIISFDQNDSYGDAGYNGLLAAYTTLKGPVPTPFAANAPIARFRYTRGDDASVPAQVTAATQYLAQILADPGPHAVGIFMTDTYGPAAEFVTGVRNWQYANDAQQTAIQKASRLSLYFSNVSFSGANSLSTRLVTAGTFATPQGPMPYTTDVFVSQVVPNYMSDESDAVAAYTKALNAASLNPSFTSLEGYLTARVFIAGLLAHDGPFTPEALIPTFENLPPQNLALGATAGFTADNHNYSKSVFGTGINADGTFTNEYFWTDGSPIQLFQ